MSKRKPFSVKFPRPSRREAAFARVHTPQGPKPKAKRQAEAPKPQTTILMNVSEDVQIVGGFALEPCEDFLIAGVRLGKGSLTLEYIKTCIDKLRYH